MIESLLIANRGEIACRVIRTAKRLGLRTVAVYSDADAGALHVEMADEAVRLGPAPAGESYLLGERILEAARRTGAQAIHPGYGFLSENAGFAQGVIDASLVWVGPHPASILAMGLKDAAKQRMRQAGVPTTPGYDGQDQAPATLQAEADAIGYPVLIKAVAGGGGKGMRRVEAAADFAEALASCQREAASSFGDDRVLIETYITSPRHIEVQVFGDLHGSVIHLFERDCSLQRRHQKVVEEAPAPGMDTATRESLCAAAVRAAKAVDYVGAGTVEFIADASHGLRADRIWFMEMNTRLQVEHPVTEAITGQDLVEWQLRVASGEPLPLRQQDLAIRGWAMEARLYAEDPAKGFLPSIGRLDHFVLPPGVRVDTGVGQGGEVTPFYDPMIAKLIAHAPTRRLAAAGLAHACGAVEVWPVRTNAGFLARALANPDFVAGRIDTAFIERGADQLIAGPEPSKEALAAAAAALAQTGGNGPWSALAGFRANAPADRSVAVEVAGRTYLAQAQAGGHAATVGRQRVLFLEGQAWPFGAPASSRTGRQTEADGALVSPMPGRVASVHVEAGARVTKGQRLLVLEAMKMEHALGAPFDGEVAELSAVAGAQVGEGAVLARIVRDEPA